MNRTTLLAAALVALMPSLLCAQGGTLNPPPGAPAPTMRSLQEVWDKLTTLEAQNTQLQAQSGQIEARTPISAAPFTISTSGSYYLTGNITVATGSAIAISADNVTLDLNGYTISSTSPTHSGTGIRISTFERNNITIRNGHIRGNTTFSGSAFSGGGFTDGISRPLGSSSHIRVSDVHVQGVADDGINLEARTTPSFVVDRCTVTECGGIGIQAGRVRDCSAETTGDDGIAAESVTGSTGVTVGSTTTDDGINAGIISDCQGTAKAGSGILGRCVTNSQGTSTDGRGIKATNALNCLGTSTTGAGMEVTNATNCTATSNSGNALMAATSSTSTGTSNSGHGILAEHAILNCAGFSTTGTGIESLGVVGFSDGERLNYTLNTKGLKAFLAIGSRGRLGEFNSNEDVFADWHWLGAFSQ